MQKEEIVKKPAIEIRSPLLLADLFKGRKDIPSFVLKHRLFQSVNKTEEKSHKYSKIFPAIGLHNFKEPCDLSKPLLDLKKENFVSALIVAMLNGVVKAKDDARSIGDRVQFLLVGAERDALLAKVDDVYNLAHLCQGIATQIDTYNNTYEKCVQSSDGKIVLRLIAEVADRNGKAIFRKNESLFKVFAKLRDAFAANNLEFFNLEQSNEFKTFCAENLPNKKYLVCFSADGVDGAWDLLTMSMRGIKSCQRWDGDYPRCLIGSIVSKYVGIIYISSGAEYEFTYKSPEGGAGDITSKGLKMMRRSLVRYAIDVDEGKPCLIVDRMYPTPQQGAEVDEETLKVFMNAIQSKTSLPVYFAPSLGNKIKHFYVPYEKIREEMPERDWTYQDTPLKTNIDFQLHVLASATTEDVNRYISSFRAKLITQIGEIFRDIINKNIKVEEEVEKTVKNIKLNLAVDRFSDTLVKTIFNAHPYFYAHPYHSNIPDITDPRNSYRKYLMGLLLALRTIQVARSADISAHIANSTSREVNHKIFGDFLFRKLIADCIKQEVKTISN